MAIFFSWRRRTVHLTQTQCKPYNVPLSFYSELKSLSCTAAVFTIYSVDKDFRDQGRNETSTGRWGRGEDAHQIKPSIGFLVRTFLIIIAVIFNFHGGCTCTQCTPLGPGDEWNLSKVTCVWSPVLSFYKRWTFQTESWTPIDYCQPKFRNHIPGNVASSLQPQCCCHDSLCMVGWW